jgi:proteasome accessory factor B
MMVLHARLQSGSYPNCRVMGEELEVSGKTIQRDLEFMRDRLNLPIAYDQPNLGYRYTEPVAAFPTIEVTAGEVLALCVAQKALAQYEGTNFQKQLGAALRKLTHALRDKVSFEWSELEHSISFSKIGTAEADLRVFEEVSQAVLKSCELHFEYGKLGAKRFEPRRLQPYHLGSIENQWYAVGYDSDREQLRTFALNRMRAARMSKTRFKRPESFSVEEYFEGSFGVFTGSKRYRIRVRFDAVAGQLVSERTWHSSQKLEPKPGGELELSLEVSNLREVERWILSWGPRARVLAPPELVERVRKLAVETARLYEGPG